MSSLPTLERMYRRRFLSAGTPITIEERLLGISVQAILQQMTSSYAGELHAYHIHLLPGTKGPPWPNW